MAFRYIKKADERLKFAATLADHIADAVIVTDTRENNFRIISWNHAAEKLYGWKAEEVIGKSAPGLIPTDMTDQQRTAMIGLLEKNGYWSGEVIQKKREGNPINIQASIAIVKGDDGKLIGAVAINRDITDRKKWETSIQQSEEKFRQLTASLDEKIRVRTAQLNELNEILQEKNTKLDNARSFLHQLIDSSVEYICVYDKDLNDITVNKRYEEILGRSRHELLGKNLLDLAPQVKNTPQWAGLQNALKGETVYLNKIPGVIRTDLYLDTYFIPLMSQDKVEGVIIMSRDVTDIVKSEIELENKNKQLNEAQQIAGVGSWDWDLSTGELSWSDNMYKICGLDPDEKIGFEKYKALLHPDDRELVLQNIENAATGAEFKDFFHRIITPGGEIKILHSRGEVVKNEEGKVVRMVGTGQDVTIQKMTEQQLIRQMEELKKLSESDIQKNNFIAMASHELKTPITSIKGYVQLLLDAFEKEKNEEKALPPLLVRSSLKSVDKQISRLTRLISELLDLSKIETGTLELKKEEFMLNELAIETVEDILYTNSSHQVNLFHDFHHKVYADKDRIGQVMINFLTNAIKYSPNSEKVNVYVQKSPEGDIAFRVQDFGIGIDELEQKRIFERFHRAKGKEEQTYPGFGIGLFIANEFIQKHGGRMIVNSEKGKGSEFTFTLPLHP